MSVTGPGFLEMDAEIYHADPAPKPSMSSGLLAKVVNQTVAIAKESHPRLTSRDPDEPEADNKKFDIGTVAHTLVLGKGRPIDVVDADAWTTKAAKEARAESKASGRTPVLAKHYEKAMAMRVALFEQLSHINGEQETFLPQHGVSEQAGFWQEQTELGKLWARALYDWRREDRLVIRDYKTFDGQNGADPDGFVKNQIGMGKDIQDPHYSAGYAAIASLEAGEVIPWDAVDFGYIVQDPNPPYLISVVKLEDRQWSFERRQWAIDRWAAAAGAGLWRGFTPITHFVSPPPWARTQWEMKMIREYESEQRMLEQGLPALALKAPDTYRTADPDEIEA